MLQALQLNDLSTAKQWLFQTYCDSAAIAFEAKAFYKAETLYQRAIALQPQVQDFYSKLATCLAQRGRTIAATAIAHLGQTLRQDTLDSVDSNIVAPQHHLVVPSGHNHRSPGCGVTCDRCMGDLIQAFRPHQLAAGVFQCDLKAGPQFPLPPQTLTQIPHGRAWVEPRQSDWVACHEVRVTTSDDRPIPELCRSYPWRLPNCKAQPAVVDSEVVDSERSELEQRCDRQSLPPSQTLAGTAVLLSTLSGHVYYHWMIDLLPRIGLLRQELQQQRLGFDHIDHFIVNSLEAKFQRETLQHLGVPLEKVIESDRVPHLQAETLLVPSFPGQLDWIPPATIDFLRQQFLPKAAQNGTQTHPKRIYISRQGARYRRVLNEDQVLEILRPYGFVSVSLEELSVCEQAALFAQAEIIVAPHGSGLTNLVFCQPHTQILEL
ncbi:MAG: glycosyltransferase family 61 protein, partial [Synechococcales cyanobacterium RU_4_20]|nr:glycosyltransferase family 61 protein [Synechococcales cyanobacterium RU_4_20]